MIRTMLTLAGEDNLLCRTILVVDFTIKSLLN